ncbi:unnamed protein product, partial [Prorocentrum cordatum]
SAPVFFRCPESTAPPRRAGTSSPIAGGQHVSYASGRDERREQEREQEQHPVPRRRAEGGGARGEGFSDGGCLFRSRPCIYRIRPARSEKQGGF